LKVAEATVGAWDILVPCHIHVVEVVYTVTSIEVVGNVRSIGVEDSVVLSSILKVGHNLGLLDRQEGSVLIVVGDTTIRICVRVHQLGLFRRNFTFKLFCFF